MAEELAKSYDVWSEHALGPNSEADLKAAAEAALTEHGAGASKQLKAEADRRFVSSFSNKAVIKDRKSIHEAILKWRVALWLMLDKDHDSGSAAALDILTARVSCWKAVMSPILVSSGCLSDSPDAHVVVLFI